jgi:antitoxin MazE
MTMVYIIAQRSQEMIKSKKIVVGEDGRLSLKPLRQPDRSALAADLHQLQATMPLTLSVIQDCCTGERW